MDWGNSNVELPHRGTAYCSTSWKCLEGKNTGEDPMGKELTAGQLRATGIGEQEAADVLERVNPLLGSLPPARCWVAVTRDVLTPQLPFALHRLLHEVVFSDWDPSAGPAPAWFPPEGYVEESNIGRLMRELGFDSYRRFHAWSARHRADFWRLMVDRVGIRFMRRCQRLVDLSGGVESPMWFPGATLNIADSCFGTCDDTPAIVFQPEGGELGRVSSKELLSHTNRAANGLRAAGLVPGDGVAIDMPMTVEAVAIYLAIVKAGCVAVSIADSFAPQEIAKRLRLGRAKAVFTQDIILRAGKRLPLYERVVAAGAPKTIVLPGEAVAPGSIPSIDVELRDTDVRWLDFLSDSDKFDPWPAQPGDHTNILFSSGTTGEPKAIPWTHTTPMKSAVDGYLHHDIRPGDVVAWPTNLGWMMGPWLIYASLVNRATIALYYGAPTGREFGVFVQNAGVTTLGVVPSLVRTWRHSGCMAGLDWGAIRVLSSTGECSNAEDMLFLMSLAGYRPIIEYCGGTEIGGGHITGTVVQPSAPATFSTAALGLDLVVLDEQGGETRNGELFLIPPAIGMSTEL